MSSDESFIDYLFENQEELLDQKDDDEVEEYDTAIYESNYSSEQSEEMSYKSDSDDNKGKDDEDSDEENIDTRYKVDDKEESTGAAFKKKLLNIH